MRRQFCRYPSKVLKKKTEGVGTLSESCTIETMEVKKIVLYPKGKYFIVHKVITLFSQNVENTLLKFRSHSGTKLAAQFILLDWSFKSAKLYTEKRYQGQSNCRNWEVNRFKRLIPFVYFFSFKLFEGFLVKRRRKKR